MKIYTKTGDDGTTGLYGGTRVSKDHIRIDSYGTVDELNAYIGLIKDQDICSKIQESLYRIQHDLFTVGAILATDPEKAIEAALNVCEEVLDAVDLIRRALPAMLEKEKSKDNFVEKNREFEVLRNS